MNSSGIKRGLATTAVAALAVTGLPFLATSANAVPIANQFGADEVEILTQTGATGDFSAKSDGTNTTVSIVAGGGANVTSVQFQYQTVSNPGVWQNVTGPVARNADGVFQTEWATPPADVTTIRAVANTTDIDLIPVATNTGAAAGIETVELESEGSLGVFQSPYTEAGQTGEYVGLTGTLTNGAAAPTVTVATPASAAGTADTTLEVTEATTGDTFNSVVDIDGYVYSAGTEANQIAFNAATNDADDAEASTLYVQTVGSITAEPATQERVNPSDSEILITVKDTQGEPVAGAQVFVGSADTDTDAGGPDTDTDGPETLIGYTDGRGQIVDDTQTTAATFGYYVNTTDNDAFQTGTDPATTATVTTYAPVLSTVEIKNNKSRNAFDLDELADGDDFTIRTLDQRGNVLNEDLTGADVQYRYVVDPAGAAPAETSAWIDAETAAGLFNVPGLTDAVWQNAAVFAGHSAASGDLPAGSYTIEARRPNVGGTGLTNATPVTFAAGEAEITWAEGTDANAPVEGDVTLEGSLALADGTPLPGRAITLGFGAGREDAVFVDAAGAADADAAGTAAAGVTDAAGKFSVKIDDPAGPEVIPDNPEDATVTATAQESATDSTSLLGDNGANDSATPNDPANAAQNIVVHFMTLPDVASITINTDALFGDAAPGQPVDLDVQVFAADGPDAGTDPDLLSDYPVTISVDNEAFLSPNAETDSALVLAEGHDATGDLYGYFKNDGAEKTTTTGDAGTAGAVVAIERNEDFDDDGLAEVTVTVEAGGVTKTENVTFDAREILNIGETSLERAAGEPTGDVTVGEELDFQLYVKDQFGNLVGDLYGRVSDDSTVADFRTDGDFGTTLSDFTTSGAGIAAFSEAPAVQRLMAMFQEGEALVDANDDADFNSKTVTVASDPINWVEAIEPPAADITATLKGRNNGGKADRLKVVTAAIDSDAIADGATVKLFKFNKKGKRVLVATGATNDLGKAKFVVADKNGKKRTRYIAVVSATDDTNKAKSNRRAVR